jgi:hypothetical protein
MNHNILVEDYIESLYLVDFSQYLDESLNKFVSNLNPSKTKQLLTKTYPLAASKDVVGFLDLVKKNGLDTKKMKVNNVIKSLKTLPADVQEGAQLSQKVLQNSINGASKKSILIASYFVALVTKVKHNKSTNYMGSLKTELKSYVSKVQQFYDEAEEKASTVTPSDLKDIAMAIGAVAIIATLVGVTLIVILSLIPWLITCAASLIIIASGAVAIAIIVALINKIG